MVYFGSSKRGNTFDFFPLFLIFIVFFLLAAAVASLFFKAQNISTVPIGAYTGAYHEALGVKDTQRSVITHTAGVVAQSVAYDLAYQGGSSDGIGILPVDAHPETRIRTVYDQIASQSFISLFYPQLRDALLYDDGEPFVILYNHESTFGRPIPYPYIEDSFSVRGNEIVAYASEPTHISFPRSGDSFFRTLPRSSNRNFPLNSINLTHHLNFRYQFQNYDFKSYNDVISFIYDELIAFVRYECESLTSECFSTTALRFDANSRYLVVVGNECYDGEISPLQYPICLTDTQDALLVEDGLRPSLKNPTYRFLISFPSSRGFGFIPE
ncbi:MAG: hypothetical protein ACMXYE_03645 [Candidatus Woesearchaeota archaeon]